MTFMITGIEVGDYETWKTMFDQDAPRARESALGYRVFRGVENPGTVLVQVEFASADDARTARERLVASGVLDRFSERHGPTLVEEVETIRR